MLIVRRGRGGGGGGGSFLSSGDVALLEGLSARERQGGCTKRKRRK